VQALANISNTANRYMKKMYLRWKKMKTAEKETYRRAVAGQVYSQSVSQSGMA